VCAAAKAADAAEMPGETCLVMAANGVADSSLVYTRQLDAGLEISWWPVTAPKWAVETAWVPKPVG
jgi:hypothetical protein